MDAGLMTEPDGKTFQKQSISMGAMVYLCIFTYFFYFQSNLSQLLALSVFLLYTVGNAPTTFHCKILPYAMKIKTIPFHCIALRE